MGARALLLPLPGGTARGRQTLQHRQAQTRAQRCGTGRGRPRSPCHHGHAGHEPPGCRGWQRCDGRSCWQPARPTCSRGRQPDFKYVLNYSWYYRGSWSTRSWTPGLCQGSALTSPPTADLRGGGHSSCKMRLGQHGGGWQGRAHPCCIASPLPTAMAALGARFPSSLFQLLLALGCIEQPGLKSRKTAAFI